MHATASLDMVYMALAHAQRNGIAADHVRLPKGISLDEPHRSGRVPIEALVSIHETIAQQCRDPDFGIHLAETGIEYLRGHVLFSLMLNSPTVGAALAKFLRYHHLLADASRPHVLAGSRETRIELSECVPLPPLARRYYDESSAAAIVLMLQRLIGPQYHPRGVGFRHERPASTSEHRRLFRCPVSFDEPQTFISLEPHDLHHRLPRPDETLLAVLESYARERLRIDTGELRLEEKVAREVSAILLDGEPVRLSSVAGRLSLGARRIQQLLKTEGTSFQRVSDGARKEMALKYLARAELSMCDVAFMLGFSDQSAFTHAFRRWTGKTPADYRRHT